MLDYRYVNWAKTLNIHLRYVKKSELVGDEEYNRRAAEPHTQNETCSDLATTVATFGARISGH